MNVRSVRYKPTGGVELVDVEVGDPSPMQVQVEGAACGICSWDIQTSRVGSEASFAAPPGHEGVGYVSKVGPGVEEIEVGQRVAGGGFARLRNVPVSQLYRIPASQRKDVHWIVEPASCAVTGIDQCQLKVGERLAIIGCGFMGLMMLQMLVGMGCEQLVALDVDDQRLALAKQMGADEAYNASKEGFADIREDLKARDIDVVVDTSGAQEGLDLAGDLARRGGRINLFGWIKGERAYFNPSLWHTRGLTIVNSAPAARLRDPFPAAIRLIDRGVIDLEPLVTHVLPLDSYPEFMRELVVGKIDGYIKGVVTL